MAEYIEREKIFSIWRSMPDPASVATLSTAISLTPAADVVSRAVYEQTAWERDIAMEQLAAHGIGFGEEFEAADRKGTNCTPAELSEEIGQKKAVAHEAEVYGERMLGFLRSFKTELEKQFGPMESDWDARSSTVGWASALKAASEKHMPEIWALWDALDWWASDLLDSWITDCAVYMGFYKRMREIDAQNKSTSCSNDTGVCTEGEERGNR